jgi:hypothetical protein
VLTSSLSGNAIVIVGAGLAIIGMTWGGIRYPWKSVEVLAPLIIGFALLGVFAVYEAKVPIWPTIPSDVVGNRTSLSAYALALRYAASTDFELQTSDDRRSWNSQHLCVIFVVSAV